MTPRTRSSNQNADFKVYYSKAVPQQVRFPPRRKTVRRRTTQEQDGAKKRQMVFLPEMMKSKRVVQERESDEECEEELGGRALEEMADHTVVRGQHVWQDDITPTDAVQTQAKKRKSGTMEDSLKEYSAKAVEDPAPMQRVYRTKQKNSDCLRSIRRQSTMTQMVDGRRPDSTEDEPEFRPLRRQPKTNPRQKRSDHKQRTLTQMVPGVQPSELLLVDEANDDVCGSGGHYEDSQEYDDAVARRLAQQGFYQEADNDKRKMAVDQTSGGIVGRNERAVLSHDNPRMKPKNDFDTVKQLMKSMVDSDQDYYKPTQFIESLATSASTDPNRSPIRHIPANVRSRKKRFGLLATPEKRQIHEIPSSQSPADSPLSVQPLPMQARRSPLQRCTGNTIKVLNTSSKRRRMSSEEVSKPIPPLSLRKFESTIQDSEDEEDESLEDEHPSRRLLFFETPQKPISGRGQDVSARTFSDDTPGMLRQIDQGCAWAKQEDITEIQETSSELHGSAESPVLLGPSTDLDSLNAIQLEVQELSSVRDSSILDDLNQAEQESSNRYHMHTRSPDEQHQNAHSENWGIFEAHQAHNSRWSIHRTDETHSHIANSNTENEPCIQSDVRAMNKALHSTPPAIPDHLQEVQPSTPIALHDLPDEKGFSLSPSPFETYACPGPPSSLPQLSTDLDGEALQVLRSPSSHAGIQQSHTSKAKKQLENEWLSYSQYNDTRRANTSSMHVAHDAFSYNATPRPAQRSLPQPSGRFTSQATTLEEVTQRSPKKHVRNNKEMEEQSEEQRVDAWDQPPALFIPSSFPDMEQAPMGEWSSPVLYAASTQGVSLEDFSIPLPPPTLYNDDNDDQI